MGRIMSLCQFSLTQFYDYSVFFSSLRFGIFLWSGTIFKSFFKEKSNFAYSLLSGMNYLFHQACALKKKRVCLAQATSFKIKTVIKVPKCLSFPDLAICQIKTETFPYPSYYLSLQ